MWGRDSNLRPLEYDANELPLLHPTILPLKDYRGLTSTITIKRTVEKNI